MIFPLPAHFRLSLIEDSLPRFLFNLQASVAEFTGQENFPFATFFALFCHVHAADGLPVRRSSVHIQYIQ